MDFPQPKLELKEPVPLVAKEFPQPKQTKPLTKFNTTVKIAAQGYHVHKCPYCSTEWSHSDASKGKVAEHTCPNCNRTLPGMWMPTQTNTRIVQSTTPPVYQYRSTPPR